MLRGVRIVQSGCWTPSCVVAMLALVPSTRVVCDGREQPSTSSMMPRTALESLRRRRSVDVSEQPEPQRKPERVRSITSRDALAQYYNAFPHPVLSDAFLAAVKPLAHVRNGARDLLSDTDADRVRDTLSREIPSGLDSGMYCIRCACEEASENLQSIPMLQPLAPRVRAIATRFETFQLKQSEHVSSVIASFLPSDFRGSLFSAFKQRSERVNRQAVEELINGGGTIRQKYDLLWQQQWKRRESLAMIGNATGVWRWLVRFLAGVPDSLLVFAREINAPDGLTEPLRAKFAPALHGLATCAIEIDALSAALLHVEDERVVRDANAVLEKCVALYETELEAFVQLLQTVIVNSPFFVEPDEVQGIMKEADARDGAAQT